ncbi:MAG: ABC-F type ribosomal protection protein [Anaerolineales bacterium]|nr:ABC-F type ribosomal protection protein [Anaerolineales bacterium]
MLLTISSVSKAYGIQQVLKNISFTIHADQHVGLIGANGVGKTTLLKIILGDVEADSGEVTMTKGIDIGCLPQIITDFSGKTIDEYILDATGNLRQLESRLRYLENALSQSGDSEQASLLTEYGAVSELFERRGGYAIDYKIDQIMSGLRISHIPRDREVAMLSGGEKARLSLAVLLLRSPDLMLLDEPTNHLDFDMLDWLEIYLHKQRGTILIVSHDRQFLNRTVDTLIEIDEHSRGCKAYTGNYEDYLMAKAVERAKWEKEYQDQQAELKALRQSLKGRARTLGHNRAATDRDKMAHDFFIGRTQRSISSNIRAVKEKILRIEAKPIPRPPESMRMNPDFDPQTLAGKTPLIASEISKAFGSQVVLKNISFALSADDRIVLMGPNGAGKSTLLKILTGMVIPDEGYVTTAPTVKIGYLDQEQEGLDLSQTLLDAYREDSSLPEEKLVSDLIRYELFVYKDVRKPIGALSIGQRRKLQIARLIAQRANVLLLDEPTNHISFDILEELEKALLDFPGAIVAVSHDRRFIKRFAHQIWELKDGELIFYSELAGQLL